MDMFETVLGQHLREKAQSRADNEYLVYSNLDFRFTYSQLDERVDALSKGLLAMGLRKGDHIGLWGNNVPDWPTVFYAAARIGLVLVTINPHYKIVDLEYVVRHSDMKALFIVDKYRDSDFLDMVNQLIPELKTDSPGSLNSKAFSCLKTVITLNARKHRGILTIYDLLKMGNDAPNAALREAEAAVTVDDTFCIMYTSGSTGKPKGVMLSQRGFLANAYNCGKRLLMDENTILCNPLPLFHVFSLCDGLIAVLLYGAKVCILENFDPILAMATIQKERCTIYIGVPTMYITLLSHPYFTMFDTSSLKTGAMGGAFCPSEVKKQIIEKMYIEGLFTDYGLTECSTTVCNSFATDPLEQRINTVGRPLPGLEITIRNPNTSEECPVDTQGEICCRGLSVMKGYYKMEEATRDAIDRQGWFHTGDLGRKLPSGCFLVTGRIKDMIIRGGENVYPKEVEDFIAAMPEIQEIQVVGIQSEKYGEEVGAFIILKPDAELTEDDVKDFCREKIARYKTPKYIFFVESFPLTASGKIQKFKLRELGTQKVQQRGIAT
jgi:fatty-acyl-CoA synthase